MMGAAASSVARSLGGELVDPARKPRHAAALGFPREFDPAGLAAMSTLRPSSGALLRVANPASTSTLTVRFIDGGVTPSRSLKAPRVCGPSFHRMKSTRQLPVGDVALNAFQPDASRKSADGETQVVEVLAIRVTGHDP